MRPIRTLALAAALVASGCSASTDSTEVGVRVDLIGLFGGKGVRPDIYPPGGTFFFFRPFSGWFTFDTAIQNLVMVRDGGEGGRDDSLRFKTVDGNDISVNVTVSWRIEAAKTPYLVQFVGQSTEQVEHELVRPVARSLIRDVLNQLSSEAYYQAERRFQMGAEAKARLNQVLNAEGVVIEQVLLGEHTFNAEYEQMIRDKKVAEQEAERLVSEALAGAEEMKRDLERMKGEVAKKIEAARGESERRRLEADAVYFEREKQAEALLSEKQALAEGLQARTAALAGAGGDRMVKLKIAEALAGKEILFLPAGGGMDVRNTDMNRLLEKYGLEALGKKP